MKPTKNVLLMLLIFNFIGCASYSKKEFRKEYVKLSKINLTDLNGEYRLYPLKSFRDKSEYNHPDSLKRYINLYQEIVSEDWEDRKKLDSIRSFTNDYSIQLKLIKNSNLNIRMYENNVIIRDTLLTGKLKNGMFYLDNKNFNCHGVPYIFGGCKNNKRRIAISKNSNLIINEAVYDGGAILIIIFDGHKYNSSYEFKRIK